MALSVENLCALLVRGKLLTVDEAKAVFQAWKNEAKAARTDPREFSKWLVARSYVSASQAAVVARWLEQGKSPDGPVGKSPASGTFSDAAPSADASTAGGKETPPTRKSKETPRVA